MTRSSKEPTTKTLSCEAITDRYIAEFVRDSEALGLLQAHVEPRATLHIAEIIEMIQTA